MINNSDIDEADRAASAKKLGLTKYLPAIDAVGAAEGPVSGDPNDPARITNEQALNQVTTGIYPVGEPRVFPVNPTETTKASTFLDAIPDAASPPPSAQAGGGSDFLAGIPDVQTKTEQAYQAAAGTDPARNAKVLQYSQHFGQPPEFIDQNLDHAELAAQSPGPSAFQQMEKDYPGSTKFYAKPENMAVAHDDIPNVVQHEALVKGVTEAHGHLDSLLAGFQDSILGRTIRGKGPDSTLAPDASTIDRLAFQAGSFINPLDLEIMGIGGTIGGAAGAVTSPVTGPVGPIAGAGAGGFGLLALIKSAITEQQKNGDPKSIQEGLDRVYAIGKETAKQMGVGALTAVGGEAAAPLGIAAKLAMEVGTMTVAGKAVEDQPVEARDLGEGLIVVGGMHAAGAGAAHLLDNPSKIESAFKEAVQNEKTQTAKNFYTALGDTAEASKLRSRLPESHLRLVSELTQGTPVENVYLPVEAATSYFQGKGGDIDKVASELGIEQELAEARATGSDIKIPLSKWVAKFAGEEPYKGLENDIKFHPEDLTHNEQTQKETETTAQVQAAANQAADANPLPEGAGKAQALESAARIYQDIQQKLKDAGLSANEVRFNPKVHEAFFSTLAKRLNDSLPADSQVDAYDLQQKFPLEVRRFDSPEQRTQALTPEEHVPAAFEGPTAASPEGQAMLREVGHDSKRERLALARKALENIPDVSADAVAEAFGLKKNEVRLLGWKGRRKGKAVETNYSQDEIRRSAGVLSDGGTGTSYDQGPQSPFDNITRIDFRNKAKEQPKIVPDNIEDPKGNAEFNSNVVDGSKFFPANENTGKVEEKSAKQRAEEFGARYGDDKKIVKAINKAQDPTKGPYVSDKAIKGIGWAPNFAAEPTGTIGPDRISQPHDLTGKNETDPLKWSDDKYGATKQLIEKHAAEGKPLVINTSSDLIGKADYIDKMPADTTVNMYALSRNPEVNRALFPGNPSRLRQEAAIDALKNAGVKVNRIEPTRESLIEAVGGKAEVAKKLGIDEAHVDNAIDKAIGPRLVSYDQPGAWQMPEKSPSGKEFPDEVTVAKADSNALGVEAKTSGASIEDVRSARSALKEIDKTELRGEHTNEQTGWDIRVSREGIAHSIHTAGSDTAALTAISKLPELIKNAVHIETEANRDEKSQNEIAQYHGLVAPLEIGDRRFLVRLRVAENVNGQKFYDQLTVESERPAGIIRGPEASASDSTGFSGSKVSIADFGKEISEAKQRLPYFQGDENSPRGQITINGKQFNIDLFKDADKSTFLHETGHFFLEVLGHVVEGEGEGSGPLQQDYASILKFLGVHSRDEIGPEQHEKFARAFEEYLSSGEAPSPGLREAFVRFRKWLTDLWKKVSFDKVEVSPEVRAVFDRMLAADEEVKQARSSLNMAEEFSPEGLDEATSKQIQDLSNKARARAEETLLKEKFAETKAAHKDKLAEERAKFRAAAEDQVKQEPLYQAIESLKELGKDPYALADAALRGELTHEQSVKFEMVAQEHGFDYAEEMAQKISEAGASGDFEKKVGDMVNEGLRQVGMIKDHDQLREEAIRSIHSEQMTELLALEREALADLAHKQEITGEMRRRSKIVAKIEAAAANAEARRILEAKPAAEAGKPQIYITQERNAAAKVARFIAKKEFDKAAEAKKQQMVAHALVRESFKIQEEAARHEKYLAQFTNRGGTMHDMPYGFVRQVDQILSHFGFQNDRGEDIKTLTAVATKMSLDGESAEDIANATGLALNNKGAFAPETLSGFVDRVNNNYYALEVPPEISAAGRRDKADLTIAELAGLRETVQGIVNTGRKYNRFLSEFIKVDMKEAAAQFKASIEKNFGTKYAEDMLPGNKDQSKAAELLQTLTRIPDTLTRTLDTVLTTCHKFDGLEEGPAKEFIYRPFAEAQARKIVRIRQAMEEMEAIFAKHYKDDSFAKYKDTPVIVDGRAFTKEKILAMALNWGNAGNKDRLLRGFGYDQATVRNAFSHLGANDWNFVQDTWDHIDKYWPEIAKLEMDVNGVQPGKVEPLKFTNEHGEFRGGYYPIAYDFEKSADAFMNNQSKDALFKQYSAAKAATANGHAQARVTQVTRALRLSLDVLTNHHEDVIHDLEFRKPVIDLNRFLGQRDVKAGIVNGVGVKGYAGIQDWLKSVAGGNSEPMSFWDQAAQWFRFKTTFFNLGFRIVSAPKIAIENLVNASSELGITGATRALKNYYLGDSGMHEYVIDKSEFMKQRAEHLNRDFSDITDKYQGKKGLVSNFRDYAFFVHAYLDQGVSFPVWAETYRRGMADHGDGDLATNQADEAVKRTFMSGGSVDQPAAMRGSEKQKALTTAYGYQSMMWNRFSQGTFAASKALSDGHPLAATAIAARTAIYTFIMPAIVTALTRELLRNGQSPASPQDRKKRIAASMIEEGTPLKFIPIVRDLQSHFVRKAFGEHTSDLQFTPLEEAMQNLIDPMAEVIGGHHDGKLGEKLTNDLSLLVGFPKQFNDVAFNFIDWQKSHGSASLKDAMSRRTKK